MTYTCPMHPEIRQTSPGNCPKCGMTLEPVDPIPAKSNVAEYTCPMHPQIVRSEPGNCPICGMSLEPRNAPTEDNAELRDMTRRFWVSTALALPVFVIAMVTDLLPQLMPKSISMTALQWLEFALATPVVLWAGWPFFQRGWASLVNRSLNMFTLIALGVGVAWTYSVVAMLLPGIFPPAFRSMMGTVPVYFEAAAVIIGTGAARAGDGAARAQPNQRCDQSRCWVSRRRPLALCAPMAARKTFRLSRCGRVIVLRVRPGEKVPVDGVVLEGTSARG